MKQLYGYEKKYQKWQKSKMSHSAKYDFLVEKETFLSCFISMI